MTSMTLGRFAALFAILGTLSAGAAGCGGAKPVGAELVSPSAAEQLFSQARLDCPDASDCPSGVAMVVTAMGPTSFNRCTGFLVAPDVLATSSACVPADLRGDTAASCSIRIRAVFPTTVISCARIVSVSDNPDYAYIRLDHAGPSKALGLDYSGLPDGTTLSVPKVNPISDLPIGELRTGRCRAVQNSYLLPSYNQNQSPLVTLVDEENLGDCLSVAENAGAPAVDEHGRARAILTSPSQVGTLVQAADIKRLEPDKISNFSLAENFSCLPNPADPAPHPIAGVCASQGASDPNRPVTDDSRAIATLLSQTLNAWIPKAISYVKWTRVDSVVSPNLTISHPIPVCFDHPEKWIKHFDGTFLIFGGYPDDAHVTDRRFPLWQVDSDLGPDLVLTRELVSPIKTERVELHFDPKVLAATGSSPVTIKGSDGPAAVFSGVLKSCQ